MYIIIHNILTTASYTNVLLVLLGTLNKHWRLVKELSENENEVLFLILYVQLKKKREKKASSFWLSPVNKQNGNYSNSFCTMMDLHFFIYLTRQPHLFYRYIEETRNDFFFRFKAISFFFEISSPERIANNRYWLCFRWIRSTVESTQHFPSAIRSRFRPSNVQTRTGLKTLQARTRTQG